MNAAADTSFDWFNSGMFDPVYMDSGLLASLAYAGLQVQAPASEHPHVPDAISLGSGSVYGDQMQHLLTHSGGHVTSALATSASALPAA
jgi:hypothetical protein